MKDSVALAGFLVVVACAAVFGAQFIPGPWYAALDKPPLNPPNWVFGPVWSVLYLAMAVAGWLVWRERPPTAFPLVLWGVQLLLNAAWSLLFFGLELTAIALVDILLLLTVLLSTTFVFLRVSKPAGLLMLPYTAWVGFAAYLNLGLWYLNR